MSHSMVFKSSGRLELTVHGSGPPTAEEWELYMVHARKVVRGRLADMRIIVVSYGGGPDSAQRKALMDLVGARGAPVVLLTSSIVARGVGTAVSWFNPKLRVFGLHDDARAFEYLGLTDDEAATARQMRAELERELGLTESDSRR